MKVHYPKLYNMAHLLALYFTASKGSNNYFIIHCIFPGEASARESKINILLLPIVASELYNSCT